MPIKKDTPTESLQCTSHSNVHVCFVANIITENNRRCPCRLSQRTHESTHKCFAHCIRLNESHSVRISTSHHVGAVAYRGGGGSNPPPPRNSEDIGGVLDRISKKNRRLDSLLQFTVFSYGCNLLNKGFF